MYKQINEPKYSVVQATVNTLNKQIHLQSENSHLISTQATPITIVESLIGFILFWTVLLAMLSKLKISLANSKKSFSTSTLNKLPCCKCQYLSHNKYLPCAVNPSVVFTEEAVNCQDYCFKG
jgi:hypothetical protein